MKSKYLLIEYWDIACAQRKAEIDEAIEHNLNLGFDLVYISYSGNQVLPFSARENVQLIAQERLTFAQYLELVGNVRSRGALFVLTNADIKLDPRLLEIQEVPEALMFAFTRYESDGSLYSAGEFSQDTWLMIGQEVPISAIMQSRLHLGVPGCENRFAEIMWSSGFTVINPSLSFVNLHIQATESIYSEGYRIFGCYRTVPPCKLEGPHEDGRLVYFHSKSERPFLIY